MKILKKKIENNKFSSCTWWWHCSHGCKGWPGRQAGNCSRRLRGESRGQCSSAAHRSWCTWSWLRCAGWSRCPAGTPLPWAWRVSMSFPCPALPRPLSATKTEEARGWHKSRGRATNTCLPLMFVCWGCFLLSSLSLKVVGISWSFGAYDYNVPSCFGFAE